ncbi:MAG: recombinase family protein [Ruminococcus flavefaciens]|nr:recombinase family protein [Ruminococcus flavefaciens]
MAENFKQLKTALYIRLSREDGDKAESLSINNQRLQLMEFISKEPDLQLYDTYIDDGYTGTNFNRPDFNRLLKDIEDKNVQCVVVKDLSRLGRNMPEVSRYINDYFPSKKVRFIAINDKVDKKYYDVDTSEDMMIDVKNMFNGFYPKDISKKVRSTFRSKQNSGQFIGAFASFGYVKSAKDHNKLEIDEYAADIVKRIFSMYIKGIGQNTIAKILNEEGIPCPSEYKKQCGLNYHNCRRLDTTSDWT